MTYKITNTSQPADPYYGAVSVLLDGRAFEDRSVNPKTIGGTFVLDTTESKWNGISYNTGSSGWQYMSVENTGNAFDFGSEDFTIEFWMNTSFMRTNTIYRHVALNFNRGYKPILIQFVGNQLRCYASGSGSAWNVSINSGFTVSLNTWYHVAFVRNGDTFTPYLNGVAGTSATYSGSLMTTASNLYVGSYPSGTPKDPFTGNFQDVRITKGVARYTSNFTPPTQPFLNVFEFPIVRSGLVLYLDAYSYPGSGTTWTDLSGNGNNGTLVNGVGFDSGNGGSLTFDGVNDYVNCGNILNFTTESFTFNIFFYLTTTTTNDPNQGPILFYKGNYRLNGYYLQISKTSPAFAAFATNQWGAVQATDSSSLLIVGAWNCLSVVRSGSSVTIYINGVNATSTAGTHINPVSSGENFQLSALSNTIFANIRIASFQAYNRALTAAEVLQNYNALKGRFGL